jgi:hypothetical protein
MRIAESAALLADEVLPERALRQSVLSLPHVLRFLLAVCAPRAQELHALVEQIGAQVRQALDRRGLIGRDIDNAWLASDDEAGLLDDLIGQSLTCRIAVGPEPGRSCSRCRRSAAARRAVRVSWRPELAGEGRRPQGPARHMARHANSLGTNRI